MLDADDPTTLKEVLGEVEEQERQQVMKSIVETIGLRHPLVYDIYNLCELCKSNKLATCNVNVLKAILKHFQIPTASKHRKADLIQRLASFVIKCDCFPSRE